MKQPRFAEQNYPCWRMIGRASSIALLGLWLAGLASQAMAQGQAPAQPSKEDCPTRPISGVSETGGVVVTLDPGTLWRPRGGEVQFTASSRDGATLSVQRIQVCIGWSSSLDNGAAPSVSHALSPAPDVRSISAGGSTATFGATVPNLAPIPSYWPLRVASRSDVGFTGVMTVPVADMVVAVTLADGTKAVQMLPVGVTSVTYAIVIAGFCIAGFFLGCRLFVRNRSIAGRNLALKLISTPDGLASLSQFQILLWTVTIGASAVYVMVLSGNLIDLTSGALVLLGIAGSAGLLARVPGSQSRLAGQNPQPSGAAATTPRWSDLVVVDGTVDVTRVQMLIFTLISAAFVTLKVLVGYAIPDIPANFLLLMGISNGIYVAGRHLPN